MAKRRRLGTSWVTNLRKNRSGQGASRLARHSSTSLRMEPLEDRRLLAAAPELVLDINDTTLSSLPAGLMDVGGIAYFSADNGIAGRELWRSDGTEAGTTLVADILPGPDGSRPIPIGALNETLFFAATDASGDTALWKTDGTESGTIKVKDVHPIGPPEIYGYGRGYRYSTDNRSTLSVVLGNELFFAGEESAYGIELWKTDGTTAGTTLVKNM